MHRASGPPLIFWGRFSIKAFGFQPMVIDFIDRYGLQWELEQERSDIGS